MAPRRKTLLPRGLKLLISRDRIAQRMPELAAKVHAALKDCDRPVAVVVLQGAFVFAADLLRHLPPRFALEVAFMRCQSYGARTRSTGRVLLLQDLDPDVNLSGRTVLLVDDILDTGLTVKFLMEHLRARGAARVIPCVLVRRAKSAARLARHVLAGFSVGREFVVGYGLDLNGIYRHLPDLTARARPFRRARTGR